MSRKITVPANYPIPVVRRDTTTGFAFATGGAIEYELSHEVSESDALLSVSIAQDHLEKLLSALNNARKLLGLPAMSLDGTAAPAGALTIGDVPEHLKEQIITAWATSHIPAGSGVTFDLRTWWTREQPDTGRRAWLRTGWIPPEIKDAVRHLVVSRDLATPVDTGCFAESESDLSNAVLEWLANGPDAPLADIVAGAPLQAEVSARIQRQEKIRAQLIAAGYKETPSPTQGKTTFENASRGFADDAVIVFDAPLATDEQLAEAEWLMATDRPRVQ